MERRYFWLKLRDNFFENKAIKKLRLIAGGDTYTIIYLKMQLKSINAGGILTFDGFADTFADELAMDINEDPENVKVTVNFLERFGLLEELPDDSNVPNCPKQYLLPEVKQNTGSESSSAARMRRLRSKAPRIPSQSDAPVTRPLRREERDIDIEKEKIRDREEIEKIRGDTGESTALPPQELSFKTNNNSESIKRVIERWNQLSDVGINQVSRITAGSKRYKSLTARLNEYGEEDVLRAINRIRNSAFLQGKVKNWKITFDWFVLPNNFVKVLEGNFDDNVPSQPSGNAIIDKWKDA